MFTRDKIPEMFLGAMVPTTLYARVAAVADAMGPRKLRAAIIQLLTEALEARESK
jgi:hypothetical protein